MNFELSPEEYWKSLTQTEARFYCFTLNVDGKIGWRLPTRHELNKLLGKSYVSVGVAGWDQSDIDDKRYSPSDEFYCYPVRDLS